ncbi:cobalamin-dependent protein, partial [Candidatus Woesearchaeota archaeon]|nr:cobalamin-dependent protein [Candidatus Woesearchaeota archaeon]
MRVLLVYPNIVESPKDISIGLGIISALLKQNNHFVDLLDNTFGLTDEDIVDKVKVFDPELVAVTAASNDLNRAIEICTLIKKQKEVMVVCGGYHATVAPEDILKEDCFDVAAIGEAEYSLIELIDSIEKGEVDYSIENLWFKGKEKPEIRHLNIDLDS